MPRKDLKSRAEYAKKYQSSSAGVVVHNKATKDYRRTHSAKYRATNAVNNAVRDGKIKKEPCVKCGAPKSQGHHEDYSRPLEVIWLCDKHHKELHRERNTRN